MVMRTNYAEIVAVKFSSYCISSFQKLIFESGRTQQYSVMHLVRCPAVLVAGGLVGTIRLAASLLKDTVFTCIFRRKIIVSDHCRHRLVFQDRLDNPTQKRRHHFTVDNWSFLFLDPLRYRRWPVSGDPVLLGNLPHRSHFPFPPIEDGTIHPPFSVVLPDPESTQLELDQVS